MLNIKDNNCLITDEKLWSILNDTCCVNTEQNINEKKSLKKSKKKHEVVIADTKENISCFEEKKVPIESTPEKQKKKKGRPFGSGSKNQNGNNIANNIIKINIEEKILKEGEIQDNSKSKDEANKNVGSSNKIKKFIYDYQRKRYK